MADNQTTRPLHRLIKLVSKEREDIFLLLMLTFGYGLLSIATPVAVQTLVNNVVIGGVIQPLIIVSLILLALLVLASLIYLTEIYLVEIIQRRIYVRSSLRIANNIAGVNLNVYDKHNTVELMNRFFDVMTIQKSAATLLTVSLTALLQGIIGSIILLFYSAYFSAAIVLIMLVLAFIVVILGKPAEQSAIKESSSKYRMAAWLEAMAKNVTLSKFYDANKRQTEKTDQLAGEYLSARKKHFSILLKQQVAVFILYSVMGTAILVLSGLLVIWGIINLGQFVAAELIIFGVLASFVRFITKLESFYDMLAGLDKVGVLFDLPQEKTSTHQTAETLNQLQVSGLTFTHDNTQPVIEDLTFSLSAGQSLAIIGESGTGKSKLFSLIVGFRSAKQGTIKLNGVDIRQLDLALLRHQMALSGQVELVDGSVLDNIKVGRPGITLEAINSLLQDLHLAEDIQNLDQGLETIVTSLGKPLSSGQWSRLMIARALIGKPKLILIDGLLDGLSDAEQQSIITCLSNFKADSMVIVTTRHAHIAKQFDMQVTLGEEQ